ncbi:MAG: beta-propeller fold lactonase family protein [Prevotella sp.]|nr:beta-propeller fold lactonase family protein [Bacteroides sp.]MCM1366025.1 beta-propeller fold lactonase family protein [Prevotella sp.]MCM1436905.1 beta-propeller fold lactonase family protein [Prevotella sp.]
MIRKYLTVQLLFLTIFSFLTISGVAQEKKSSATLKAQHPKPGAVHQSKDGALEIKFAGQKQNFSRAMKNTFDVDIQSPKSVNVHPNGKKYYVNSLEGGKTVVYDQRTSKKLKVIKHTFDNRHTSLWAPPSPFYKFNYNVKNPRTFTGKPVESTFSHNGRYLWIPYYRRSFDINAQDPSAIAIIDTETDEIIRLMDTGPLPKMIAASPDGKYVAVSHWGDNTVGLIDISSQNPKDWKHVNMFVIDNKLQLNFSRTVPVNRDNGSGNALRGTVFTPDGKYLLVSCMGGNGGIGVIDLSEKKYLGKIYGMMSNVRHMVISNDYLYLSINNAGYVQRIPLKTLYKGIATLGDKKRADVSGWQSVKVGGGARTIELTPDGKYVYVACNSASALCIVDTEKWELIATVPADSFPVGLDIFPDGHLVYMTMQGRKGSGGGNAVDIFRITRLK